MAMRETGAAANARVIDTLNNLIETCKDGQNGFETAAENIQDANIRSLFEEFAQERADFVAELQNEVRRLGGDPEKAGSAIASVHRGWINLKSAITGSSDHAILAECERGEDAAVDNYEDALREPLPMEIRDLVHQQFGLIKQAHDRVRALRDSHQDR